jgi:purine-binding chemotaxis protein CheW
MTKQQEDEIEYVTVRVGEQQFGIPIARVQDVFMPERLTRVPLSPPEIAGVLNLRGRIVTAVDMRRRLDLPPHEGGTLIAVGIEQRGEAYALIVDTVGDVIKLPAAGREPNPVNLDPCWSRVAAGVHRLEDRLMIVLDADRVLELKANALAA